MLRHERDAARVVARATVPQRLRADAHNEEVIAAVNRCATQNQVQQIPRTMLLWNPTLMSKDTTLGWGTRFDGVRFFAREFPQQTSAPEMQEKS